MFRPGVGPVPQPGQAGWGRYGEAAVGTAGDRDGFAAVRGPCRGRGVGALQQRREPFVVGGVEQGGAPAAPYREHVRHVHRRRPA
ncbi:hypothetical protein [Streptomyces sp. NPDC001135]